MELLYFLLDIFKILIPFLIISFASFIIIRIFKITGYFENFILIFLLDWCQIIFAIEILSIFHKVSFLNIYIFHIITLIIVLITAFFKKINLSFNFYNLKNNIFSFYKNIEINKYIKFIFISWLAIILLTTFIIGVITPPKNWDSLTGYLFRAGIWLQQQSINHFFTPHAWQLTNPINPSIGFLWVLIFTRSDNIIFLLQWISGLIIIFSLYKILRKVGFNRFISSFTAFIFISTGLVTLELCTSQHDLILSSFIVICLYLAIKIFEEESIKYFYLILFGFSAGIALGSKAFTIFFIPGFLIFSLFYKKFSLRK